MRLAVVLRDGTLASPSVEQMLARLQVWRVAEDRLVDVSRAAAQARLGEDGWQRAGVGELTSTPVSA